MNRLYKILSILSQTVDLLAKKIKASVNMISLKHIKTITYKAISFIKNIAIVLVSLSAILSFVYLLPQTSTVVKWFESEVENSNYWEEEIKRLTPDTTVDYFRGILGPEVFRNQLNDYVEYIFVNDLFFVQAVSNNEQVIYFSITTRSEDFSPTFTVPLSISEARPISTTGMKPQITIGKTRLSSFPVKPSVVKSYVGVRRFLYTEFHDFGNPGNYLTYTLSLTDASTQGELGEIINNYSWRGFDKVNNLHESCQKSKSKQYSSLEYPPVLDDIREDLVINTFGVSSPHFDICEFKNFSTTIDKDQVRVLPIKEN